MSQLSVHNPVGNRNSVPGTESTMNHKTTTQTLFQPKEISALFTPANELALSLEGLYYLGVFTQPDSVSKETAA